uniref:Sec14 protein n=1 Tax=Ganoderma boninense TaxID=34458 RepID=A0A5K1K6Q0_9APHY|nr:Putative Sec14 protein [Ganoderma boninense]
MGRNDGTGTRRTAAPGGRCPWPAEATLDERGSSPEGITSVGRAERGEAGESRTPSPEGQSEQPHPPPPAAPVGATANSRSRKRKKRKNRTRAKITVASLNMRGYGRACPDGTSDKWDLINQVIRDNHIAILALQETHLSDERLQSLHNVFGAALKIMNSGDPTNETGARGVAFAINTRMVQTEAVTMEEIVPGRVIVLTVKWGGDQGLLRVVNVYAPNNTQDNAELWRTLGEKWRNNDKPDIMMGDFNLVEDAIDRIHQEKTPWRTTSSVYNPQ